MKAHFTPNQLSIVGFANAKPGQVGWRLSRGEEPTVPILILSTQCPPNARWVNYIPLSGDEAFRVKELTEPNPNYSGILPLPQGEWQIELDMAKQSEGQVEPGAILVASEELSCTF